MYTEKLQKIYEDFLRDFVGIVKKLDKNVLKAMEAGSIGLWIDVDKEQAEEYRHRYGERLGDEIFYVFHPLYEDDGDPRSQVCLGFNLTADGQVEPLLIEEEVDVDPQIIDIMRFDNLPNVEFYPEILYNFAYLLDKFVKYLGENKGGVVQ
jgi:hypothetical protein